VEIIREESGKQFNPVVVKAFLEIWDQIPDLRDPFVPEENQEQSQEQPQEVRA